MTPCNIWLLSSFLGGYVNGRLVFGKCKAVKGRPEVNYLIEMTNLKGLAVVVIMRHAGIAESASRLEPRPLGHWPL